MKTKLLVVLFFSFLTGSYAQVAGYLGKRAVISYSNYFMLGFKGPGPNAASWKDNFSPTLNNVNCLNFEYTYQQRKNICLTVQYLRTGIAYQRGEGSFLSDDSQNGVYAYPSADPEYAGTGYQAVAYKGNSSIPALLTSMNFGLGYKLFKNGFVAPVGRYQKFEFLLLFETVKYNNKNFVEQSHDNYYYPDTKIAAYGLGEYKYKNVVLSYTIGKQHILFDKIVLDHGIRFGFSPAGWISSVFGDAFRERVDVEDVYKYESRTRIFRQQLINFHLGIGFLAF